MLIYDPLVLEERNCEKIDSCYDQYQIKERKQMTDYYKIIDMGNGIYHIWEPARVASTLIIGNTKALLIDTGYGYGNLKSVVRSLTDLSLRVVNTHCHLDHAGGNYLFQENTKELRKTDNGLQKTSVENIEKKSKIENQPEVDYSVGINPYEETVYHLYQTEQKPLVIQKILREKSPEEYPWPQDFDMEKYLEYKECKFDVLQDGEIIDLGARKVKVIFLPGHTKGSVVFFDELTGTLFSGDNIGNSLWIQFDQSANVYLFEEHLKEVQRLPIQKIISSHKQTPWSPEIIQLELDAIAHITLEDSTTFIHPRTGARALKYKYPIPEMNGVKSIYVVYKN